MNYEVSPSVVATEKLGSFNGVSRFISFFVVVVALVGCFSRATASPPSVTVDVLSFTPPAGWETEQKAGSGPMTMSDVNQAKDISCQITVYNGLQSSGDLATDFFSEWTAIIGSPLPAVGDVSDEGARIEGVALAAPVLGQNYYIRLITYSAGEKIATIVVLAPNLEVYEVCSPKIDSFLASVTVNSAAIGTQRINSEQQEQTQANHTIGNPTHQSERASEGTLPALDNPMWVAEWNKSTRMSDLSGEWRNTERDGGTYWTATLSIRTDGTFTSSFEQRGNVTASDENHGTWTLSPRPLLKYAKGSSRPFNILHFTQLPDGSSTMSILDSHYPINETNRMVYESKYVRAAP